MKHFFGKFAPELLTTEYGKEMWSRYASSNLDADTPMTGTYQPATHDVNLDELMAIIDAAREKQKSAWSGFGKRLQVRRVTQRPFDF